MNKTFLPWMIGVYLAIFIAFFTTRLVNLRALPIFTDEAIYVRWSQIGSRDANWRFISLTDGKQPLYTWAAMGLMKIIDDPLIAGRVVSVFAGFISLTGIIILSYILFRSWNISIITGSLYVVYPFAVMYDRLALYDSLVAALSIWSTIGIILLVRNIRLDIAILTGVTVGAAMLNKTSGFLNLYLMPLVLLLFDFRQSHMLKRLLYFILFGFVVGLVSQLLYGILRLSPFFHLVAEKDTIFVYPFREWIEHPLRFLVGNLSGLFDWLFGYMGHIVAFFAFVAPLLPNYRREKVFLFLWWIVPFVGLATFGRVLYPRFILFMTMPLLILVSFSLYYGLKKYSLLSIRLLMIGLIFIPMIYTSHIIIVDPLYANIPRSDRGQLMDDWPSGYGVPETTAFFQKEIQSKDIAIYTEGTFGLMPFAYEIYLVDHPRVKKLKGLWPLTPQMPVEMKEDSRIYATYFVLNESQKLPDSWNLQLITEYQKGVNSNKKLRLFKVVPESL